MQETPAAADEDTPEATTTRGVAAATAEAAVAAATATTAASSAPRARSDPAGRSARAARSDPAAPSDPRAPSGAGRAAEVAVTGAARRDAAVEETSATAHSSSSRKAP